MESWRSTRKKLMGRNTKLSPFDKKIIYELLEILENFVKSDWKTIQYEAIKVEEFAIQALQKHEDRINPFLEEVMYGFLDMHHYGDKKEHSIYDMKKVKIIISWLRRIKKAEHVSHLPF